MFRIPSLFAVVISIVLVTSLRAEKVDMSPEKLRKTATHVIKGEVLAIYVRSESKGDWNYKRYVAEIRVRECEKGDGINQDGLVYVRYWRRRWMGAGRSGPNTVGHRGLPTEGESLRVYLARHAYDGFDKNKDGGFNVIGANGFEVLKPEVLH